MPRAPRFDAPGALHHVIARGIDRSNIFRDDTDRTDFLDRLRTLFAETGTAFYAWSLLSNHFHILARSGPAGISKTMQRILGGYVTTFVIDEICAQMGRRWSLGTAEIAGPSRRHNVVVARALVAFISVRRYGFTQTAVARALGVSKQAIF